MGKGRDNGCAACGACACCCILVLVVIGLAGLGIAKIVMGSVYLHDCDLEPLIPIFLIVSGVAPILLGGFGRREGEDDSAAKACCAFIGFLFNFAWLICGSVWVYPNYGKRFDDNFVPCTGNVTSDCTKTCDEDLMKFSFAMVTIDWICFGFWCVMACLMIRKMCGGRSCMFCALPVILIQFGLGVGKIYMGVDNFNDCPIQPTIPVLTILSALLPLIFGTLITLIMLNAKEDKDHQLQTYSICYLIIYLPILFIASAQIYYIFCEVTNPEYVLCSDRITPECAYKTCDVTFITFSIVAVTFDWLLTVVWLTVVCYIFVFR